ncbi:MAG: hypothetical protein K0Q73_2633, partial [Paenibacillus sp.]|nr:hypothetical protein [Paenibacillus sp.]
MSDQQSEQQSAEMEAHNAVADA